MAFLCIDMSIFQTELHLLPTRVEILRIRYEDLMHRLQPESKAVPITFLCHPPLLDLALPKGSEIMGFSGSRHSKTLSLYP